MIEQALWDAYCSTLVTFVDDQNQGFVLTPSSAVDGEWIGDRATEEVLLISAANPYSELISDDANLELEVQMKARFDELRFSLSGLRRPEPRRPVG